MFGSIQEQEEYDFFRYDNDLQAAYAYSCSTMCIKNDTARIQELNDSGKYVIGCYAQISCPSTDASMGTEISVHSIHDSYAAAQAVMTENGLDDPIHEGQYQISSPADATDVPVFEPFDLDCPF